MITGKVTGEIYSTIHHPYFGGKKLLIVEKTRPDGSLSGDYLIAVDHGVDAGVGDPVLVVDEGNSARQIVDSATAPLRSVIVGIIDAMDISVGERT
jgi:ethanolamine utilization protein EutN